MPFCDGVCMSCDTVAPLAPSNVRVATMNSSALQVMWDVPASPFQPSYNVSYHPTNTVSLSQTQPPLSQTSILLDNLSPFTNYSIVVIATTQCGTNLSEVIIGVTAEAPPSTPLDVAMVAALPTRVRVQWREPNSSNGIITHYNVSS